MIKKYKGLIKEPLPSGNFRYRVREHGNPAKKITVHLEFDDPKFTEHYQLARKGITPLYTTKENTTTINGSVAWLCDRYLHFLEGKVKAGTMSPKTLKKRNGQFKYLKERYADYDLAMPNNKARQIHDDRADQPSSADDLIEMMKGMYDWAIKRGYCVENPATGIERYNINKGGTVSWSHEDVKQYKDFYQIGTTEYTALALILFTACRVGDTCFLGRRYEQNKDGDIWLKWQPGKKGSLPVEIPMAQQLYEATRAQKVFGPTYLLTAYGQPFASEDSASIWFSKRCRNAGLKNRSAHGLRKAAGAILAEMGCTNYEIMALHGHSEARTSEVYTKGADRRELGKRAVQKLSSINW